MTPRNLPSFDERMTPMATAENAKFVHFVRKEIAECRRHLADVDLALSTNELVPKDIENALRCLGNAFDVILGLFQIHMVAQEMFYGRTATNAWDFLYGHDDPLPEQMDAMASIAPHVRAWYDTTV